MEILTSVYILSEWKKLMNLSGTVKLIRLFDPQRIHKILYHFRTHAHTLTYTYIHTYKHTQFVGIYIYI